MRLNKKKLLGLLCGSLTIFQVSAAQLTLKDGRSFDGEIKSHHSDRVIFNVEGIEMIFPTEDIKSIDMAQHHEQSPLSATQQENETVSAPEEASVALTVDRHTVNTGSTLMVKISKGFNSRHHKSGQRFSGVLESNLMSGNAIVAPKGSEVYGVLTEVKKAGRIAGSASLSFTLTELSIAGTLHSISTHALTGEGENTAKETAGKTARATAIGGLVNGSSGAKNGAKVGVGASILTQGNDIEVPDNSLLDFILASPLIIEQ
ncbi:hypothetical protein GCM10007916_12490 [Psychromonas marina]|uniref:DUF5666 domain-containing protein n=1 Tax=Psychromonas marina TaxID=88364 RepID=A0ABQ6DYK8_9GAMM|nr:hypothetical protein [Psychromonas marina]GLS90182.1 hypothetical protein GCM10007916_12490 [Psychromonas marina]